MENNNRIQVRKIVLESNINEKSLCFCGTIYANTKREMVQQAKAYVEQGVDMLEIRLDALMKRGRKFLHFFGRLIPRMVIFSGSIEAIRGFAPDIPILMTLRSKGEGGQFCGNKQAYDDMLEMMGFSNDVDMIDVELSDVEGKNQEEELLEYFLMYEKPVVLSKHILSKVPFEKRIEIAEKALQIQEESTATVCKLAVYVENAEELRQYRELLLSHEKWMARPHIGIAMGPKGAESRYNKQWCGSCMTFVCDKKCVAPGQMSMEEMKRLCYNSKTES